MSPIAIFLLISMLIVIYFDVTRFIIPNWLVGALLLVYPLAVYLSPTPVEWMAALGCMLAVFVVGYFIFSMNWMGGGDIKLITVLTLWVGMEKLPTFFFGFAIFGGLLSLSVLLVRKLLPHFISNRDKLPRILKPKEPVPYGVAIAAAFLFMLYSGQVPGVGG